jgi:hypothetical protein
VCVCAICVVRASRPGSHKNQGWETFTDKIISLVNEHCEHVVFMLWGKAAQSKQALIDITKHRILLAAHPSPLSCNNGFFGCKHFSQANQYLEQHQAPPIDWSLTQAALPHSSANKRKLDSMASGTSTNTSTSTSKCAHASLSVHSTSSAPTLKPAAKKQATLAYASTSTSTATAEAHGKYVDLAQINPFSITWSTAVLVRVTYKSPLMSWKTDGRDGCMFYVDLIDAQVCLLTVHLTLTD